MATGGKSNADMELITAEELLAHSAEERNKWREFFKEHPGALDLPTDIAGAKNVRELVHHILVVDVRYADRLDEREVTAYKDVSAAPVTELFACGEKAEQRLREFARRATDADWQKRLEFQTRSAGTLSATKRKIFLHTMLHGMRHWAQLATYLRTMGYKTWPHDFLFTETME